MSAGHPDGNRVESTGLDPDRFAWKPGETGAHSGDAVATVPRRCRGGTDHQKQLFGLPLLQVRTHHIRYAADLRKTPQRVGTSPVVLEVVLQSLDGDLRADLVAVLE